MNLQDDLVAKFVDDCYDAGMKDPVAFLISKMPKVFNWLKGAFPRRILPTDVDGEVELNGHFLRLEFKSETALREGRIPKGQHRAFQGLLKTERFTVFLIGTNQMGDPTCLEIWRPNGDVRKLEDASKDVIFKTCEAWAKYAQSGKAWPKAKAGNGGKNGGDHADPDAPRLD